VRTLASIRSNSGLVIPRTTPSTGFGRFQDLGKRDHLGPKSLFKASGAIFIIAHNVAGLVLLYCDVWQEKHLFAQIIATLLASGG